MVGCRESEESSMMYQGIYPWHPGCCLVIFGPVHVSVDRQRPFSIEHGGIDTCRSKHGQMMEDLGDVGSAEGAAGVDVKLQQTPAIFGLQNDGLGITPEVEGDVTCLYRTDRCESLIIEGFFHVIDPRFIQGFHVNIRDNPANQSCSSRLVGGCGTPTHLHAQQEVMMLDSAEVRSRRFLTPGLTSGFLGFLWHSLHGLVLFLRFQHRLPALD